MVIVSVKTHCALAIGTALLLSACSATPEVKDVHALIVNPTEGSRAELVRAVTMALNGAKVVLADDALTQSSLLTIERKTVRDLQGRRLTGRDVGRPHQFRLIKHDSECVLMQLPDEGRWVLAATDCIAE